MADSTAAGDGVLDYVEVLASEGAALIAAVREGPQSRPVAACPGWDVTALSGHVGKVWRWASRIVGERLESPVASDPDPTLSAAEAVGYLETGLVEILDVLRACPPDAPVWSFGKHPRTAAFWRRRMAHETVVHRVDAELAVGQPAPVDPALAADGVDELLDVLLPRLYRGQDPPAGQWQVQARDTGHSWRLGDPSGGVGTMTGTAEQLLLVCWQRRGLDLVDVGGDAGVVERWRALGAP